MQPYPGTELRQMLDLCLFFIPAHRLKVHILAGSCQAAAAPPLLTSRLGQPCCVVQICAITRGSGVGARILQPAAACKTCDSRPARRSGLELPLVRELPVS